MKKMIAAGFVFLVLLAVVAGCPNTSGSAKPNGRSADAVDFGGSEGSAASSDETAEDIDLGALDAAK